MKLRLLLIFIVFPCWGGMGDKILGVFNSLGVKSNYTNAAIYKSQAGGFLAGGNLQMRTASHTLRPVHIRWPSISGGMCNLSIAGGGISYITKGELRDTLKNIATGAVTYSFLLAMQVMVPSVEGMMTKMNSLREFANKWSVGGCRASEQFMGGLSMRNNAVRERVCNSILTTGIDYVGRGQQCRKEQVKRRNQNLSDEDAKTKNILKGSNYNVAWIAIKEHSYLKQEDATLKQFYMSLTGSIIVKDSNVKGEKPQVQVLASLLQPNLLSTLLRGGTAEVYSCGNDKAKCLTVTQAEMTLSAKASMLGRAKALLKKFAGNIRKDIPLESDEQTKLIAFLEGTRLPILRMLYINLANTKGAIPLHLDKYAEIVAYDILYDFLIGILNDLLDSAESQHKAQLDEKIYSEFIKRLEKVKLDVLTQRQDLYRRHQVTTGLIEETRLQEQQAVASLDVGFY